VTTEPKRGVVVTAYEDHADGVMRLNRDGSGQFEEATLSPHVTTAEGTPDGLLADMHHEANQLCFIARSVNFPVRHAPTSEVAAA